MVSDQTDICISDSNEDTLPSAESSEIDSHVHTVGLRPAPSSLMLTPFKVVLKFYLTFCVTL